MAHDADPTSGWTWPSAPASAPGCRPGAGSLTASREVKLGKMTASYYRRPTPYGSRFAHLPAQQRDFATAEARTGSAGCSTTCTVPAASSSRPAAPGGPARGRAYEDNLRISTRFSGRGHG